MSQPVFPSFPDLLRTWRHVAPERIALVDRARDVRLTYAQLDAAADDWAAVLRARGVCAGDRVAALCGTRHEMVSLLFACGRIGAALVPLNWRLAVPEQALVLEDARVSLLVGDAAHRATAEALLARPAFATVAWLDLDHDLGRELRQASGAGAPDHPTTAATPLLVLYTSGSTGRPKGVVLPQRQLLYNAIATTTAWEIGHRDVVPVSTPLFHTGGWNVFATPAWLRGGTVVLFDRFEPRDFLAGLAEEGCTMAFGVPTQLQMLLDDPAWGPIPSVRRFVTGGAPCPAPVAERIRAAGYAFRQGYGLTECGPNCFVISDEEAVRRPGSVGWPMPFLEMRVVRDDGNDVAEEEPGELWLRGPQLFAGYLHAPERTAEVMAPGGWLRTGDLAARDAAGAHRIVGRRKEMFISGGENVFPGEVEAVLAGCPGVHEVVVIGVPDERWGEVGYAYVVADATGASTPGAQDVIAWARGRLAGYKIPKRVVLLPALPRLGSGKPDRRRLATLADESRTVVT